MVSLLRRFKLPLLFWGLAIFFIISSSIPAHLSAEASGPELRQSVSLKHRILVIDLTEDSNDNLDISTVINIFGPQVKIPRKGAVLSRKILEQVAENIKSELV